MAETSQKAAMLLSFERRIRSCKSNREVSFRAVNETAGVLQARSLISYSRGRIQILDLRGLTAMACPCYGIIRKMETARH